ncbi:flavin reductase family protein [Streptomyces chiangmaiensis]|uniref:Flavin reductase family protein n=1 Tax=Streptomyces chiangmaiensis TaxID=766497 RepID=A0ABU7FD52_9ACTN|nr:flavin reductase family protein [Streptomyces chiangmaiensis]MED7822096.1 flavin reductase family protein [Streptomyces chiangmaiensis]
MGASTAQDMRATYRGAMSRFTTGVTIITTRTPDGPAGMTASAVASVSLDPLMLLVCVGNTLATRNAISESGVFAVSVLSRSQEQHALRFASRCEDKFAGLGLRTDHDLPVLEGAVAHFACNVKEEFAGGDHTIFVGQVVSCGYAVDSDPLVYFGGKFGSLCDLSSHAQLAFEWQLAASM